jgi:serine/threonine protein kinase
MLSEIGVRTGWFVDGIDLHFSDGTVISHGKPGGKQQAPLKLLPQERVTAVEQIHARHTCLGLRLTFETSTGRRLGVSGTNPQRRKKHLQLVRHELSEHESLRGLRFEGDQLVALLKGKRPADIEMPAQTATQGPKEETSANQSFSSTTTSSEDEPWIESQHGSQGVFSKVKARGASKLLPPRCLEKEACANESVQDQSGIQSQFALHSQSTAYEAKGRRSAKLSPLPPGLEKAYAHEFLEDRFQILSQLGKGSQSTVYQVKDKRSGRMYAAKWFFASACKEAAVAELKTLVHLGQAKNPVIISAENKMYRHKGKPCVIVEFLAGPAADSAFKPQPKAAEQKTRKRGVRARPKAAERKIGDALLPSLRPGDALESFAATALRPIVEALVCMHANGYMHRDVKPENIVFAHADRPETARLIDFSFSLRLDENEVGYQVEDTLVPPADLEGLDLPASLASKKIHPCERMGSYHFTAPEVLGLGMNSLHLPVRGFGFGEFVDLSTDIFSLGLTLHWMLIGGRSGTHFDGTSIAESLKAKGNKFELIASGWYRLYDPKRTHDAKVVDANIAAHLKTSKDLSPEAKDLLHKMLRYDPSQRISAEAILKHPWIMKYGSMDTVDEPVQ